MGETFSKEIHLASDLREGCDYKGKETNPTASAEILHQFGLLYQQKKKKDPDKIKLVQSAAFLNAAIVRQPRNQQFQEDLKRFCSHVLQVARAAQQDADLVWISRLTLVKVKHMRKFTKEQLEEIDKISSSDEKQMKERQVCLIRNLQNGIAKKYKEIMEYVSDKCIKVMGKPPCAYAVVGLGSLARKEVTPYSDFEHVIVLEEGVQHEANYQDVLEYFRWFSVIFHIVIINLKETIVRSVAVPWLNDDTIKGGDWFFDAFTTCGIKFDGMQIRACKIPLGRTRETDKKPFTLELIKPISEMVNLLRVGEDLKNGYHLADMLTRTCFVSGRNKVYENFQSNVHRYLSCDQTLRKICEKELLDNKNFKENAIYSSATRTIKKNIGFLKMLENKISVKQDMYREISFLVTALGRRHSVKENSCFEIVDSLQEMHLLDSESKYKLLHAITVACSTRLKQYMKQKGQDDNITRLWQVTPTKTPRQLIDIVGENNLIDFFLTTSSLENAMFNEDSFASISITHEPVDLFCLLLQMRLFEKVFVEWDKYSGTRQSEVSEDDKIIRQVVSYAYSEQRKSEEGLKVIDDLPASDICNPFLFLIKVLNQLDANRNYDAMQCIAETKSKAETLGFHNWIRLMLVGCSPACKSSSSMTRTALDSAHDERGEATSYRSEIVNFVLGVCLFFCNYVDARGKYNLRLYKQAITSCKMALYYANKINPKERLYDIVLDKNDPLLEQIYSCKATSFNHALLIFIKEMHRVLKSCNSKLNRFR